MYQFNIDENIESEIVKLMKETSLSHFSRFVNSKYGYLLDYLKSKYPLLENRNITEYLYWLVNNLHDFPLCKECNSKVLKFYNFKVGYSNFCSNKCAQKSKITKSKIKETFIEKYGVDNPAKSKIIKDKIKQTCIEKYGVDNVFKSKDIHDKFKNTMLKNYNCEYPSQNKDIREKQKKTCYEHYGVCYPSQSQLIQELQKIKTLEKFGTEYPLQNKQVHDKLERTCLEKYGKSSYSQTKEWKDKIKKTSLERYGTEHPFQCYEIQEKQKKTCLEKYGTDLFTCKYTFEDQIFDSAPELIYYIWLKNNQVNYQYHPNISFQYFDDKGKSHYYYPDFYLIDNKQIVEIKGSHFFVNDERIMVNPYSGESELYKYQCMLKNNVKIIRDDSDEYLSIRNNFNLKYGGKYLEQFKIHK